MASAAGCLDVRMHSFAVRAKMPWVRETRGGGDGHRLCRQPPPLRP